MKQQPLPNLSMLTAKFPPPCIDIPGPLMWAHVLLTTDAALSSLQGMYDVPVWRSSSEKERVSRMFRGYFALRHSMNVMAENARNSGVLLYCWQGSKAFDDQLSGGAA